MYRILAIIALAVMVGCGGQAKPTIQNNPLIDLPVSTPPTASTSATNPVTPTPPTSAANPGTPTLILNGVPVDGQTVYLAVSGLPLGATGLMVCADLVNHDGQPEHDCQPLVANTQ